MELPIPRQKHDFFSASPNMEIRESFQDVQTELDTMTIDYKIRKVVQEVIAPFRLKQEQLQSQIHGQNTQHNILVDDLREASNKITKLTFKFNQVQEHEAQLQEHEISMEALKTSSEQQLKRLGLKHKKLKSVVDGAVTKIDLLESGITDIGLKGQLMDSVLDSFHARITEKFKTLANEQTLKIVSYTQQVQKLSLQQQVIEDKIQKIDAQGIQSEGLVKANTIRINNIQDDLMLARQAANNAKRITELEQGMNEMGYRLERVKEDTLQDVGQRLETFATKEALVKVGLEMHVDLWSELFKPKPYSLQDSLQLNSIEWRASMLAKDFNYFASKQQPNLEALLFRKSLGMRPLNVKPRRNSVQPVRQQVQSSRRRESSAHLIKPKKHTTVDDLISVRGYKQQTQKVETILESSSSEDVGSIEQSVVDQQIQEQLTFEEAPRIAEAGLEIQESSSQDSSQSSKSSADGVKQTAIQNLMDRVFDLEQKEYVTTLQLQQQLKSTQQLVSQQIQHQSSLQSAKSKKQLSKLQQMQVNQLLKVQQTVDDLELKLSQQMQSDQDEIREKLRNITVQKLPQMQKELSERMKEEVVQFKEDIETKLMKLNGKNVKSQNLAETFEVKFDILKAKFVRIQSDWLRTQSKLQQQIQELQDPSKEQKTNVMVSMLIELQTCVLRMMLTPGDLVFRDNIYSRQQLLSTLLSWINSETQGVPFEFQPVHQPYQMLHKDQETATESVPSEVEELKQRVRQNKLALWTNKQLAKDLSVKSFRSRKAKYLLMTPSPNTQSESVLPPFSTRSLVSIKPASNQSIVLKKMVSDQSKASVKLDTIFGFGALESTSK